MMMMRSRAEIMTEWDAVRTRIADGCASSGPRDWLDGVMDDHEARIAELEVALRPFARYDVRSGRDQVTVMIETADINEARRVLGMKVSA